MRSLIVIRGDNTANLASEFCLFHDGTVGDNKSTVLETGLYDFKKVEFELQ